MDAYENMIELKRSIDKQNELQEESNQLMRGMISTLQHTAQEILELRRLLNKQVDQ